MNHEDTKTTKIDLRSAGARNSPFVVFASSW
jgi:hypothetical protein